MEKNNKLKKSAPTWDEESELPDGSYSVSNIQDYFKYFLRKHETVTDTPSMRIQVNKIENIITFKIKAYPAYYLKILTPETMKLLGNIKSKITKDENGENFPHLEITEVVLIHFNVVNNDYQQDSRVLYRFDPNKSFGQLLDILPKNLYF